MTTIKARVSNPAKRTILSTSAKSTKTQPAPSFPRPGGKLGVIIDHLAAKAGATADELVAATGWQKHSVLGALSKLKSRGIAFRLDTRADRKAYRLEVLAKPFGSPRAKG
jgi:hypothetical protein